MALTKNTKTGMIIGCLTFGVITGLGYFFGWWDRFLTWKW